MQPLENNTPTPGGFFVRLAAFLIDCLIIGAVLLIVRLPVWLVQLQNPDNWFVSPVLFKFSIYDIFLYLAAAAYFIALTYTAGATIGKRLMNLRVVANAGEGKLTLLNVIYRETIGRYLSSLLFIGYFMIGASQTKQALHDWICDTKVIYTCKCQPTAYGKTAPSPAYGYGSLPSSAPQAAAPTTTYTYGQQAVPEEPQVNSDTQHQDND